MRPSTARVLNDGVCLNEILKFVNFYEMQKCVRVNKAWQEVVHKTPELLLECDYRGFSVPRPAQLARNIPRFCEKFMIDVEEEQEVATTLEFALSHRSLRVLHILKRRADGSVILPRSNDASYCQEDGLLDGDTPLVSVALQFPLTNDLAQILTRFGARISSLSAVETTAEQEVLAAMMRSLVNVNTLNLGYVTDKVDFDTITREITTLEHLRHFDASDLNISFEALKSLRKAGKTMFNPLIDSLLSN